MNDELNTMTGRRLRRLLACGLAVAAVSSCDDDASEADDAPSTDITSSGEQPESSDGRGVSDPVAEATAFWEAVIAGDRDTAAGFVDPAVLVQDSVLFGRAETLEKQFDWYEAVGWEWTLDGCVPSETSAERVKCDLAARNPWSDALGVGPVGGTFVVEFDDDGFLSIVSDSFGGDWVFKAFQPFQRWVRTNHPDDAEVMWRDEVLSEEAIELFEVNTERFAAARQQSGATGDAEDGQGASAGPSAIQAELMAPGPGRVPVDFTIDVPDAETVTLEMAANYWGTDPEDIIELPRVDDERGSHAVTLHLGDDQWQYRFRVDGFRTADPTNLLTVVGADGEENSLLVVGETLPYLSERPDVVAGEVREHTLRAGVLGEEQTLLVYTPPGYSDDQRYPLLVLLHGGGMAASSWVDAVAVDHAMDNLIDAGELDPFVVAMPNTASADYDGDDPYTEHVFDEVLPFMDANYSLDAEPGSTAIGGLSLGGHGTVQLAYLRPDRFGLALPVMMAAGPWCDNLVCDDVAQYEEQYPDGFDLDIEMWVGANDDLGFVANHELFAEYLDARGLPYEHHVGTVDGHYQDGHSVRYVRTVLPDLLRRADEHFTAQGAS